MPRTIGQAKYYSLIEVCREVDISRSTLLRWMKAGPIGDKFSRDRRGWRVFTEMDMELIKKEANKIR